MNGSEPVESLPFHVGLEPVEPMVIIEEGECRNVTVRQTVPLFCDYTTLDTGCSTLLKAEVSRRQLLRMMLRRSRDS